MQMKRCRCRDVEKWVIISMIRCLCYMLVILYIVAYDSRRPVLALQYTLHSIGAIPRYDNHDTDQYNNVIKMFTKRTRNAIAS